jgi:thioesterase domain-containing protein/acyl carrier protein
MAETEDGLLTAFEYSRDLFEAATVRRMLEHFERVLAEVVAAPERPLSEIHLLTEEEGRELERRRQPRAPRDRRAKEAPAYLAPRDELEFGLARIMGNVLGVERVGVRDSFFDLGGHSLMAVRLALTIKREFGRELPIGDLLQGPTVEQLAGLLRQGGVAPKRSALVPIRPGGTRRPFFCVHPVGGSVLCYAALAQHLGPEQPFYAFQLPALEDVPSPPTIEGLAAHYLRELRAIQPQGPYRLGGWSMGGVIAFEMARLLSEEGEGVSLLALIDSYVPRGVGGREGFDGHDLLRMFARDMEGVSGRGFEFPHEDARRLPLDEALGLLLERARASEAVPEGLGLPELRELFRRYSTSLSALLAYEPRAYAGKLTLFKSGAADGGDAAHGWEPYAASSEVLEIEGDHYSIVNGPPVKVLAARLGEMLNGRGDHG